MAQNEWIYTDYISVNLLQIRHPCSKMPAAISRIQKLQSFQQNESRVSIHLTIV